ncbi:MAG: bifunctional pyr operon transcriptional regulator/uracil phosphoribosyltransferase PyrR [Deltaproteobacteria bacterium]|jgi:pyrimidine operon attenuation protein/uracil phosphoribosyltransferase|nr:bifunctional pyr operon transcriptional regulator/uracil phosphoribosyltransferase PyrR [Deltaproteobacteria bacterium]
MTEKELLYGPGDINLALTSMASEIIDRYYEIPFLVGIRRGGVTLSERLAELMVPTLGQKPPLGIIDINLYRDDWTRARSFPKIGRTEIPFTLDDRRVILVDDVLYTGRTARAALDAITEFGRPGRVELAVLVDRGHREMPIQADYAPFVLSTSAEEMVEVNFSSDSLSDEIVLLRAPKNG